MKKHFEDVFVVIVCINLNYDIMKTKVLLSIGLVVALFVSSCSVEEAIDEVQKRQNASEALSEYVVVSQHFQNASNSCDEAAINAEAIEAGTQLKVAVSSPVITIEPKTPGTAWPKIITVNFGDGVVGVDGVTRKGKIIIESTNLYQTVGSVHTSTFENYYQNDYKVEGIHIATNISTGNTPSYNVEVKNGKLTTPENEVISYTQNSTRTWIKGSDTPLTFSDDEYELDGTQTGVSSKGVNYTIDITTPIHYVFADNAFKAGIMVVNVDGLNGIEINYTTQVITIGAYTFPF